MILDKFSEFIFEQASRFLTKWRIFCFFAICTLQTEILFEIISERFWLGSVSQGASTLASIFDLPVYLFSGIFILCFLLSPLISKTLSMRILAFEYKRAEQAIQIIEQQVNHISVDSLPRYRDNATSGERHIQKMRGLNECLICLSIFGGINGLLQEVTIFYYFLMITTPFLFFFSVRNIFATYLRTIFFYKKLSEHFSA